MSKREYLFSVSIRDCEVQSFRAGGKGGQHQNKTSSGVRVIHHPSGARGESREHRSWVQNRRAAFDRMAETLQFKQWVYAKARELPPIEQVVDEQMDLRHLKIEVRDDQGKWTTEDEVMIRG